MGEGYTPPASSGSGAVSSVAGRTGDVVLAVADVSGAAPSASPSFSGTVTLPSGLVLPANVVLPSTADISAKLGSSSSTAAAGNDARLSDARTPTAHKTSHATGGSDALAASDVGAAPIAGAIGGPAKFVRRTSDSAARNSGNTGATLTNDDTLLFTVGASDVWWVEAFLLISAANQTMDFQMQWSLPASGVLNFGATGGPSNSVGGYGATSFANNAIGIRGAANPLIVGTGTAVTVGLGAGGVYVGGGTAGTVTMQWAQNTADAGNLIMLTNSFLRLTRLA